MNSKIFAPAAAVVNQSDLFQWEYKVALETRKLMQRRMAKRAEAAAR